MSALRIGSVCSGYGGLDMAVQAMFGGELAWFYEFEKAPSKILVHHWPTVPNHGDLTTADWAGIEPVNIMCGGTPCQDLSGAGKRAGMTEGTRSNLWVQMREGIAVQRPQFVVWENVRGAFSAYAVSEVESEPGLLGAYGVDRPALRALGRVLGDLSDLGYDAQWCGVRAADAGAPHNRFRVFVVAHATGEPWSLGNGDHVRTGRGTDGRVQAAGTSVDADATDDGRERSRSAWGRRTGLANDDQSAPNAAGSGRDGRAQDAQRGTLGRIATAWVSADTPTNAAGTRRAEGQDSGSGRSDARQGAWRLESERGSGERIAAIADAVRLGFGEHTGESSAEETGPYAGHKLADHHRVQPATNWGPYAAAIHRWERVLGRVAPSPTENTGRNGQARLSPLFVEWMMGLPTGWVTSPEIGLSRNDQLKALGNGVVPQQAELAIGRMLSRVEAAL